MNKKHWETMGKAGVIDRTVTPLLKPSAFWGLVGFLAGFLAGMYTCIWIQEAVRYAG